MSETKGRFWLCASCGRHVPARLAQCRCGFSPFGEEPATLQPGGSSTATFQPGGFTAAPSQTAWFAVGTVKLVVMSVATLGLYQIYWFYQQWKRVRDGGEDVWPLPRAIFGVLFSYPLFQRMAASSPGDAPPAGPGLLAVAYGLLCLSSRLPLPFGYLALFAVLPLLPMQRLASAMAERDFPHDDPNRSLTAANWVAVAVGCGFVGLLGYATFYVERISSREFLTKIAAEANAAPRVEKNGTMLERVEAMEGRLVYYYAVSEEAQGKLETARPGLKGAMKARLCQDALLRNGVAITFVYNDKAGRELATAEIGPADCRS